MISALTPKELVKPVLMALQVLPPLVLLKTPPPLVPAYSVEVDWGSITRASTEEPGVPRAIHVLPTLIVLKETPPPKGGCTGFTVGKSVERVVPVR
jgi:hypothetical protein